MSSKSIQERVSSACEQILQHQPYINLAEVLKVIGLLKPIHEDEWRKGKIPNLEMIIEGKQSKINEAIACYNKWALEKKLTPLKIISYARTSGSKKPLQYSLEGNPEIESIFQTYYFSQSQGVHLLVQGISNIIFGELLPSTNDGLRYLGRTQLKDAMVNLIFSPLTLIAVVVIGKNLFKTATD